jgi:hypothetical protein
MDFVLPDANGDRKPSDVPSASRISKPPATLYSLVLFHYNQISFIGTYKNMKCFTFFFGTTSLVSGIGAISIVLSLSSFQVNL